MKICPPWRWIAFASPVRKRWASHYLRWIGDSRLELMGYDPVSLNNELQAVPPRSRSIGSDLAREAYRRIITKRRAVARQWLEDPRNW